MNRIDRLFGIMVMLQAKKYVPAEKIAEKFSVSIRTVYRDVKALCEQGVPVSFEQGRGYFVVQGYFLPPVSFTNEEASALLLAASIVTGFADGSVLKHYTSALEKVKCVLRSQEKEQLEFLEHRIKMQFPACMLPSFEHLTLLQKAIAGQRVVQLYYNDQQGQNSQRNVEPLGLIFYAFNWHLAAWCHLRQDYRDFRVSRISSLRITGDPFSKTDHIPLTEYMKKLPVDF